MFETIKNKFNHLLNIKTLIILAISVVFIGVALYVYNYYVIPRLNPSYVANKEFVEKDAGQEAELYYFYTEWCPHCKKATPIWKELQSKYENAPINNTKIYFRSIDCDKNEKVADEFKVEGYPTIKLVKNGQIIEYDAKPDMNTLEEFLHTQL